MRRFTLAVLLGLPALAQNGPSSVRAFFDQVYEERLRERPVFATNAGRHEYDARGDDRWTDWSKAGRERRRTQLQQQLRQLATFSRTGMSPQDRLSADLLAYNLRSRLDAFDLDDELFAVMQQNGLHNTIYLTIDRMP